MSDFPGGQRSRKPVREESSLAMKGEKDWWIDVSLDLGQIELFWFSIPGADVGDLLLFLDAYDSESSH